MYKGNPWDVSSYEKVFMPKGKLFSMLHFGVQRREIRNALIWDKIFKEYFTEAELYHFKGEARNVLTGDYSSGELDNIMVFSNVEFEREIARLKTMEDEPTELLLINVPEQYREAAEQEMMQYVEANCRYEGVLDQLFYSTDQDIKSKQADNALTIMLTVIMMLILNIGALFTLGMKSGFEVDMYRKKYEFYTTMGMKYREQRKLLSKEFMNILILPTISGMVFSIIFILRLVLRLYTIEGEVQTILMQYFGIFIAYYIILFVVSNLMKRNFVN